MCAKANSADLNGKEVTSLSNNNKVFEIVTYDGIHKGCVEAKSERQALCIYLMEHEELYDMMLWWSTFNLGRWQLAEYDCEDQYLWAREAKSYTT